MWHTFGFVAVRPAECELTVKVINKDTGAPMRKAWVILRPNLYRASTDESGVVKIGLPRGEYKLTVQASERAPKGTEYEWKHYDAQGNFRNTRRTTDGKEFMLYVPEANKDCLLPFKETIKIEGDTAIRVELVGVIEPPEKDTL